MENQHYIIAAIAVVIVMAVSRIVVKYNRQVKERKRVLAEIIKRANTIKEVTELHRGTDSERILIFSLIKSGVSPKALFHDLYVEISKDKFSQIDLVLATKVGIIVFEVKDYSGWIFGNGNHSHWTQILAYGREKHRFYNPIAQNRQHIENLKRRSTQFNSLPYYSVIVFFGNCELKEVEFIPQNTYVVKSHRVAEVVELIQSENT
ncbi:MAG: nuclease-related domain-containing protein, partial [Rikenellaceae bacterium]